MKLILLILSLYLTGCTNGKYETFAQIDTLNSQSSKADVEQYLLTKYKGADHEQLYAVAFDDKGKYIADSLIKDGATYRVKYSALMDLYPFVAKTHAKSVWLIHNHIGTHFANPSENDLKAASSFYDFAHRNSIDGHFMIASDHDFYEQPRLDYHSRQFDL